MLSILIWAYLRHLSVQCHAEPSEPFGSVRGAESTTLQTTPDCGPEVPGSLASFRSRRAAIDVLETLRNGRLGSGESIDLRFEPETGDGTKLDIRLAFNGSSTIHKDSRSGSGRSRSDVGTSLPEPYGAPGTTETIGLLAHSGAGSQSVNDVIGMNITPALSQVLLAPSATSGFGLAILMAANGAPDDNGTRGEEINSFYFYETEQFAVMWVLFTVIVLGNSAVLVTLTLNRTRKSRMNFFIKQLAIADLCVGLLSVLTDNIWRTTVVWRAGNTACKTIRFVQACVTYASTYVLVALSIDRYDAITHPMNFSGCWSRARKLVAAAWSLSILFSLPIIYFFEERLIQGKMQCWIDLVDAWRWQLYMCWVSGSLFVIPALIISACYAIIVRTIWSKGTILGPTDRAHNGMADLACRRASSRGIIPRAKVKTVKMTIVIVIVFVLCWSPYIIFDLLQVFEQIPKTQTNVAIATFIQSLAPLNSAANPLIYCLFSTQVCRMIKRLPPFRWLWSTKWCCKQHDTGTVPLGNGSAGNGTTGRFHNRNSSDSMRTLTTSLTVSRRSCMRPARVVIVERPKTELAMSAV
ncbi:cardioacceleratory peptide receptor-like [Anopheles cruzii]|uniref:cardioacceleratory peptide receptor-like n=1 Tax=Anopheles cruzii TaxID=68878 RepID=UPI0022EC3B4C|nr:cardioacceleratory peptide receptor-like [Anopheles cruzii]